MATKHDYQQALEDQLAHTVAELAEARMVYQHMLQMRDTLEAELGRLKSTQLFFVGVAEFAPPSAMDAVPTARLPRLPVPLDSEFAPAANNNGCGF